MKEKLIVATLILLLVGLFGTVIWQTTNLPLYAANPTYRIAVALEKEYPFIDVWDMKSDGEFIYIFIFWADIPEAKIVHEVNDTVEKLISEYKTTEKRVIFGDIVWDGEIFWVVSFLSCPIENLGTDKPLPCEVWPWPIKADPNNFPWIGPTTLL